MTKPAIYILFIGGAADKESFLWGNINIPFTDLWPHRTMGELADFFRIELNNRLDGIISKQSIESYKIDYVSYTDIFFEEFKEHIPQSSLLLVEPTDARYLQLKENINDKTKVYIIGHSLGGWNGAHLSYLLSQFGIKVECLITLDPVGTGNHEVKLINPLMKKAQIYTHSPIPVAKYWFNIQARHINIANKQTTGLLQDWIAWAGGQWLIDRHYPTVVTQISEVTNYSHKEAFEMFTYRTKSGLSAHQYLFESIIKEVKHQYWQRFNPIYWLKKLLH